MNCALHEPITGSVNFDVFIKKYAAVHIGTQNLGESVHYTKKCNGMS